MNFFYFSNSKDSISTRIIYSQSQLNGRGGLPKTGFQYSKYYLREGCIREPLDLVVRKKIVYGRHNHVTFPFKTILSKQLKGPTPILNRQHSYNVLPAPFVSAIYISFLTTKYKIANFDFLKKGWWKHFNSLWGGWGV